MPDTVDIRNGFGSTLFLIEKSNLATEKEDSSCSKHIFFRAMFT